MHSCVFPIWRLPCGLYPGHCPRVILLITQSEGRESAGPGSTDVSFQAETPLTAGVPRGKYLRYDISFRSGAHETYPAPP